MDDNKQKMRDELSQKDQQANSILERFIMPPCEKAGTSGLIVIWLIIILVASIITLKLDNDENEKTLENHPIGRQSYLENCQNPILNTKLCRFASIRQKM